MPARVRVYDRNLQMKLTKATALVSNLASKGSRSIVYLDFDPPELSVPSQKQTRRE